MLNDIPVLTFIIVGVVLAVVFAVAVHVLLEGPSAQQRLEARQCREAKPAEGAADGDIVKVECCVEIDEGVAPLRAPISGLSTPYLRFSEERESADSFEPVCIIDDAVSFGVRTATGLVGIKGARFDRMRGALRVTDSRPVVEANEASKRLLASRGRAQTASDGFVRRHRYEEHFLPIGARVFAVGRLLRLDSPSVRTKHLTEDELPRWSFLANHASERARS